MYKFLTRILLVSVMTLAFAAQPFAKNKEVHNKAGTEAVSKAVTVASADVIVLDYQQLSFVAPAVSDMPAVNKLEAVKNGENKLNLLASVVMKPPKYEGIYSYKKLLTDFKTSPDKWKDFHRRCKLSQWQAIV